MTDLAVASMRTESELWRCIEEYGNHITPLPLIHFILHTIHTSHSSLHAVKYNILVTVIGRTNCP